MQRTARARREPRTSQRQQQPGRRAGQRAEVSRPAEVARRHDPLAPAPERRDLAPDRNRRRAEAAQRPPGLQRPAGVWRAGRGKRRPRRTPLAQRARAAGVVGAKPVEMRGRSVRRGVAQGHGRHPRSRTSAGARTPGGGGYATARATTGRDRGRPAKTVLPRSAGRTRRRAGRRSRRDRPVAMQRPVGLPRPPSPTLRPAPGTGPGFRTIRRGGYATAGLAARGIHAARRERTAGFPPGRASGPAPSVRGRISG